MNAKLFLVVIFLFISSCSNNTNYDKKPRGDDHHITVTIAPELQTQLSYPLAKLEIALTAQGKTLRFSSEQTSDTDLNITLTSVKNTHPDKINDGYILRNKGTLASLNSEHWRGLLYGVLHIIEELEQGKKISTLDNHSVIAQYPFRAIKFNLPWYSYRSGENLSVHMETARDLKFWESFLDMMVENKFNTLTLWNLHPYMYMVKSKSFPKASPFTDDEMNDWRKFWKTLFKMAKVRGIDSYVINWNIFVSDEFAKEYNSANYKNGKYFFWGDGDTNPVVEKYTREMVTQTIDEYEDLTGIGLTLGERMGGMTSEQRRDWADRTILAGFKNAKRKARLIYRAPLSAGKTSHGTVSVSTEQLTRTTLETMDLDDPIWVEFKFNWSHGHSSPKLSLVHGGMLTDTYWEPPSDKYVGVWTVRNEDFFVMRWAQPDFIRDFIRYNSQHYVGGAIIGSETYIPAKDYITRDEHRSWDYAFERQWLFYKVWGNLLYNKNTPDTYFSRALADKFDLNDGTVLLDAWKLSSMNANHFASFFRGTWDATIYTEGFTTIRGEFINVNKFIVHPVLDQKAYLNIVDYVKGDFDDATFITPIEHAQKIEKDSQRALHIIAHMKPEKMTKELQIELTDIEFWSHFGFYLANKIRGGVALHTFRSNNNLEQQKKAVAYLEQALKNWKQMVELAEKYNRPVMPHQFDPEFSWRKHIPNVEADITIAKKNIITGDKIDLR